MLAGWIVMGSLTAIVSVLAGIVITVLLIVIFVLLKRYLCGHTILYVHITITLTYSLTTVS